MKKIFLSIVVPVFKTDKTLELIVERALDLKNKILIGKNIEIIFVNDSPFFLPTVKTLQTLRKKNNFIKVVELTKNFGQHAATLAGLHYSQGDLVVTLDDDMQHDPFLIPKLLKKHERDIVIARLINKKHTKLKKTTSVIKQYFDYIILKRPKNIRLSSFRLLKRDVLNHMLKLNTSYPFLPALFFQVTSDVVNVNIEHNERIGNKSSFTFRKRLNLFKNLIFNNSYILLKALSFIGVLSLIGCFSLSLLIIYNKITHNISIAGWSSLFVMVCFFGGMTMISFGVFGEYLIRIINTAEKRPLFFVKNFTESKNE